MPSHCLIVDQLSLLFFGLHPDGVRLHENALTIGGGDSHIVGCCIVTLLIVASPQSRGHQTFDTSIYIVNLMGAARTRRTQQQMVEISLS